MSATDYAARIAEARDKIRTALLEGEDTAANRRFMLKCASGSWGDRIRSATGGSSSIFRQRG